MVPSHYTQTSEGEKVCVFKLAEYRAVLKQLKAAAAAEVLLVEEIPWATFNVVECLSRSFAAGRWAPVRPEHLPDDEVDRLIGRLPRTLLERLLPFQHDGLRFALRRGARCLIADDMGLGKTLQVLILWSCLHCGDYCLVELGECGFKCDCLIGGFFFVLWIFRLLLLQGVLWRKDLYLWSK